MSPPEIGRAPGVARAGARVERSRLAQRLRRVLRGEVRFDAATRARYATDASIYRIEPLGVVVPADETDVVAAIEIAREEGTPVLPRGAGSSRGGQTVGEALVIDHSRHLNRVLTLDPRQRTAQVQPGVVLDSLNAMLKPHGLWFPVDVRSSAQATIGGMTGNNSCGPRSIVHGGMVHNVVAIDALLADGVVERFGPFGTDARHPMSSARTADLVSRLFSIGRRERAEIERAWPKMARRASGYNLDVFHPQSPRPYTADGSVNLAHLLVGSEGTLAWFQRIELALAPLPVARVLGAVNFPTLRAAMESAQHIARLGPSAVELVDRSMIELARANPASRPAIERASILRGGAPAQALLFVEFAGDEHHALLGRLERLAETMADHGLPGSVVALPDAASRDALWDAITAALDALMSLRGDGKPVSFIEDCAVPLEHLADCGERLGSIFARHGSRCIWYGHASAGALHVRPILDLRAGDATKMRRIAEEATALVRQYGGSFSGGQGDGLVRSEWIGRQFGERLMRAFEEVKDAFDPGGTMNPGKIVRATPMDDARLFRDPPVPHDSPAHAASPRETALDWSAWNVRSDPATGGVGPPGSGADPWGGFAMAAGMCDGNGRCRRFDVGTMCPSWRVTLDERHLTRGRANTLRAALTGRLGDEAQAFSAVHEALELCVGCKACRRECPNGVDMSRMKIEFLDRWNRTHPLRWKDRLIAWLPRYARHASRWRWLLALRDRVPGAAWLSERLLGFPARRPFPRWRGDPFTDDPDLGAQGTAPQMPAPHDDASQAATPPGGEREVVLWADTFDNWFEPDNLRAARTVLRAAGYRVHIARALPDDAPHRPLCCGRTFLATGLVAQARVEARRTLAALAPYIERGVAVVGLEPSCLLTMRDEFLVLGLGEAASRLAGHAMLFEEFLVREHAAGRLALELHPIGHDEALLHGHCHQESFGALRPARTVLGWIPGLSVHVAQAGCCGMAGAFGYDAKHYDLSMRMGELSLLPTVRAAKPSMLIVSDGTSCRRQIADGAQREAVHVARVLERALRATGDAPGR